MVEEGLANADRTDTIQRNQQFTVIIHELQPYNYYVFILARAKVSYHHWLCRN